MNLSDITSMQRHELRRIFRSYRRSPDFACTLLSSKKKTPERFDALIECGLLIKEPIIQYGRTSDYETLTLTEKGIIVCLLLGFE